MGKKKRSRSKAKTARSDGPGPEIPTPPQGRIIVSVDGVSCACGGKVTIVKTKKSVDIVHCTCGCCMTGRRFTELVAGERGEYDK